MPTLIIDLDEFDHYLKNYQYLNNESAYSILKYIVKKVLKFDRAII